MKLGISLLVFAAIFHFVGVDKIVSVLLNANPLLLLAGILTYILLNIMMSWRISAILESIGHKFSIKQIFQINLGGMLASDFTPARAGYFFTAFSIASKFGLELEKPMIAIFGPQIFDFMIKAASAGIIIFIILGKSEVANDMLLNAAMIITFFGALLFVGALVFYPPLLARFAFLERFPAIPTMFGFLRRMHQHIDRVLAIKWKIILITFATWIVKGFEWFFLSRALGISVSGGDALSDLLFMMIFQASVTIIQFLPIPTLAGAGASEAGFAAILMVFGVPLEVGVSFGFLTRFVMIAIDMFGLPTLLDYLQKHSLESSLEGLGSMGH